MAKKDKEFRLCYVDGNIMYFTDNFQNQTGDDWNDAPYDCNAGTPYEWNDKEDEEWNKHHGHLRYIGFIISCGAAHEQEGGKHHD